MNRQYVGARYVVKVYENSQNPLSAEWEQNVNYEPLTMVTYNYGTYVSKKPVPANIGNPSENGTYWTQTGFYNGQISNLQNQINTLNTRFDNLENKKYVIITDSYGGYQNSDSKNFAQQIYANLGITNSYQFYKNSTGIARPTPLNFLDVLQENETSITDKDEITDMIVVGGANDQISPSAIDSGISAFVTYVKANYPNAKIHIGCVTRTLDSSYLSNINSVISAYKTACSKYGVSYIDNSEFIMMRITYFQNDNCHPTANGVDAIAKYLTQYIIKGHFDVREKVVSTLTSGSNATISNDKITQYQDNGIVTFSGDSGGELFTFSLSSSATIPAGITGINNIANFTDGFLISTLTNNLAFPIKIPVSGVYYDGQLYVNTIGNNMSTSIGMFVFTDSTITVSSGTIVGVNGSCHPML